MGSFDGLLLLDKPKGMTSHDVVLGVRRLVPRGLKVGHTGTLDPMATGLLVLVLGRATKSASHYQKLPKVYRGRVRFGQASDSGDLDGRVTREGPVPAFEAEGLRQAMSSFIGELEMPPPMYSAVKYKGKPLYDYARKGIEVPLKNRSCRVFEWELLDWTTPELGFRLRCSHGTYARSLAVHLGERLGTPALLSELRRESIGEFEIAGAITLDALSRLSQADVSGRLLQPAAAPA
ncbi:MAG: tRNA pseudouridine(55) synthase TruB [Elusimicrobia bacterium]|nr:tRNA pseudouridine(55) synthase TruB [Elusimicrobiota bacterium]